MTHLPLKQMMIDDVTIFSKYVRCRQQSEWICDFCMACGDKKCCPGKHIMFRLPKTDDCICSNCLEKLKK